jgi:glycosyltransferase 2 family protein
LKKFVPTIAKIGISVALLGYVGWQASRATRIDEATGNKIYILPELLAGPKDWTMLALALLAVFFAVLVTILRWHMLLRTLGLQFTTKESIRAGFMGYLFNLLPLGLAGADAVKAGFLIHRNPSRKTEAIATVIIDRIIGLYALLVMAGLATLMLDFETLSFRSPEDKARTIVLCRVAQYLGLGSTIAFGLMLIPGATKLPIWDRLEHVVGIGPVLKKLVDAMRTYRQSSPRILLAVAMSFAVHTFYVAMVYFVGRGILDAEGNVHQPDLATHFVFTPISMVAGALPIGAFEATLNGMYYVFSPPGVPAIQGFLIALTYRLLQVSVATIGVFYYLAGRQEVQQLLDEAEQAEAVPATK